MDNSKSDKKEIRSVEIHFCLSCREETEIAGRIEEKAKRNESDNNDNCRCTMISRSKLQVPDLYSRTLTVLETVVAYWKQGELF